MPDELNLIQNVGPIRPTSVERVAAGAKTPNGVGFKQMMLDSINEVNRLRGESETAINKLATGQTDSVAEVMSAVRKADVAYTLLMEVKNHMVDAYQELRQMRV